MDVTRDHYVQQKNETQKNKYWMFSLDERTNFKLHMCVCAHVYIKEV